MKTKRKLMRAGLSSIGVCTLLAAFATVAAATQDLIQVSKDPYTDPFAEHATEVEPVMVVNGETIVTAFQVGRFFSAGSDNIGWATSQDGGRSWKHGFLRGTTAVAGGSWHAISLPVVAYDRKHATYLIAMMPFDEQGNGLGILVSRSADGITWGEPLLAASSSSANGHWLACDNSEASSHYGNCYDAFLVLGSTTLVNVLVSSGDGGLTWGDQISSPDQSAGLVTSIAIQPNGNVVILGRNGGPDGDLEYAIRSVDGGQTLEETAVVAENRFTFPFMRADAVPTSGVDSKGTIYVVFPDCRFRSNCTDPFSVSACRFLTNNTACPTNDLVLTKSVDGIHWSAMQRIPIDPVTSGIDHFIPGLGVLSGSGASTSGTKLALTYYYLPNGGDCFPNTCLVDAGFISSDDGGTSWHKAVKVAGPMAESWLVPTYAGEMVADYISAVFVDGEPFGAFAIARPPNPETGKFNEAIYVAKLPD